MTAEHAPVPSAACARGKSNSSNSRELVLTTKVVNTTISFVLDIQVIEDPAAATVALGPMRSRLLSELAAPASAATLAARVGVARQKVNYHLNALEAHGLVRLAQERKWGGLTERLLVATAASYVVSPGALGPVAADPNREIDRLSASYLIALGARVVREVGDLVRRANRHGQTPGDPGGGYRGSLPVGDGTGSFQQRTHRGHHETRFEVSR